MNEATDLGIPDFSNRNPVETEVEEVALENQIPKPVGYALLILMPKATDTYESGIVKAGKTIRDETLLSMVGAVLDMGDMAYRDESRFPTGAWCKQGDYVMFRSNSGTRFKVGDQEYRLINDDTIEAVVTDPAAIKSIL